MVIYSQQKQSKERDQAYSDSEEEGKKKNTERSLFRNVMFRVLAAKILILPSQRLLLSFFLSAKLIHFATVSTHTVYIYPVIYSRVVIEPPKGVRGALSVCLSRANDGVVLFCLFCVFFSIVYCIKLYNERVKNRGGGK